MKTYAFKGVLETTGWKKNVAVQVDAQGVIQNIGKNSSNDSTIEYQDAYALPGFQNAHSHAFQYAMVGLAERHSKNRQQDDFWGWREAMYQLALTVNPDQMQAIAAMVYSEMVRHGYTHVAEFNYVHHDANGKPYSNLGEMGSRLIAAAQEVGIGITLVPILYQKGGFGKEPSTRQKRFISPTLDDYLNLWNANKEACQYYENANMAIGVHSMRGVEPSLIVELAVTAAEDLPFHIHVSEQLKEIEDAVQYLGKRPVQWLLDKIALNERFHLVHATHMTDEETKQLAASKANVVICPSTEGNLGDGFFSLRKYQEAGGNWSIGTDSHIGLNPFEELRLLDYGQRLRSHRRDTFTSKTQSDSGMHAISKITEAGRRAMGNTNTDFFKVGRPLNAALIDASAPILATTSEENLASTMLYSSDASMALGTICKGELHLNTQKQSGRVAIIKNFARVMKELKNR